MQSLFVTLIFCQKLFETIQDQDNKQEKFWYEVRISVLPACGVIVERQTVSL